MNKNIKYILLSLVILFLIGGITFGATFYIYNGDGTKAIGKNLTKETSLLIGFSPNSYDKFSNLYLADNKRMYFDNVDLDSEVYGEFKTNGRVDLIKSDNVNTNCGGESVSYYFEGEFINDDWGMEGFEIISDSSDTYFCPDSGNFSFDLTSKSEPSFFENFVITNNDLEEYMKLDVKDVNGNIIEVDERVIFSNMKISVAGNVNKKIDINDEFSGGTENQQNMANVNFLDYDIGVGELYSKIKKNIEIVTRGEDWNNSSLSINNFSGKDLFDYSGSDTTPSNLNNRGKNLVIGNQIRIDGENLVIVKGGNIYIKDDLYNNPSDESSILTIIALRDENNKSNGGNIYIDPKVTNIDAVLIAEGSLMSFNGTTVLDSTNDLSIPSLRNQLLIYGSLVSRNTIGSNSSPFNSDDYIKNGGEVNTSKYNLENLRSFQVVRSSQISGYCNSINGEVSAIGINETTAKKEAFAGKKECYLEQNPNYGLRSTHRTASTVIEYNPILQVNPPRILRIN